MSQASSIFRANSNSGFYSAVKARKSASQSCKLLYNQEVNYCPSCRSKVETFSNNTPAYSSIINFELPNFSHLAEAFVKIVFKADTGHPNTPAYASNRAGLIEGGPIHFCQTIKLISDGVEICRTTPEAMLCHYYKNCSNDKRRMYQQLTGGYANRSLLTAFPVGANRDSVLFPESRSLAGSQTFYLPLNFFFSALEEQMNRALPLSVLERVFIEIQTADASHVGWKAGTQPYLPVETMSIISFLTELDPAEEAMYRNASFSQDQPLSVLSKNYITHIERGVGPHVVGADTAHDIRLNMFSGQISKLYVVVTSEVSSALATPLKNLFQPELIKSLILEANGVEIYKMTKLCENEKFLEDWVGGNYTTCNPVGTAGDADGGTAPLTMGASWSSVITGSSANTTANDITMSALNTSTIDPAGIYEMSFATIGADLRDSSMTGSINFSNLSTPTLKVVINGVVADGYGGLNGAAGKKSIIVVGVQHNLVSYSTNNAGRVSLRSVS